MRLNSGSGIRVNNAPGTFSLDATAPLFSSITNIGVTSGFLNIGAGGLNTAGRSLTGFDHITVAGSAVVGSIQVRNALAIGGTLTASAANGAVNLDAGSIAVAGGVNLNGAASRPGGSLTVNATNVAVGATGINGITANGSDGLLALAPGGNGGTVNIGTAIKPVTNAINVTAPISATTGANATGLLTGGNGGTVKLTANGAINVNSSIKVSDSAALRASKNGGVISIASRKTSGTAITVNNSGQLLALLNSASTGRGGTVTFASSGGDIVVNGGTVTADRGTVDVRNYGAGAVNLANANIRGDIVKVGALGANGQLIIGGGNISADTTLKLYGGTSNGQVRFTDNVTLGGAGAKIIAGKTVTINPTKVVTIGGASKAKVYTTTPNYTGSGGNGSSSGSFGGAGASTLGYSGRPIF